MSLGPDQPPIDDIRLRVDGRLLPARVVDAGNARQEVHPGDWAILKVDAPVALPALEVDLRYAFPFGDRSSGWATTTPRASSRRSGLVGQPLERPGDVPDGWTSGRIGGGVLDADGHLVGIPVGRLQGDFRFSFILPLRSEMLRKVPQAMPTALARARFSATPASLSGSSIRRFFLISFQASRRRLISFSKPRSFGW